MPIDPSIPLQAAGSPDNFGKLMQVAQVQQMNQAQQQKRNEVREHKRIKAMADRGTGLFLRYQTLKENGFSEQAAHAAMQEDWGREIGGLGSLRDDDGSALFSQDELGQFGREFNAGQLGSVLPKLVGAERALDLHFKQQEIGASRAKTAADEARRGLDARRQDETERQARAREAAEARRLAEAERHNRANEARAAGGGGTVIENEDGTQTIVPPPGKRTPVPSEIQARMALGENYAKQVPDLLAAIDQGKSGSLGTALNFGDSGLLAKRQESGVDALVRNLTGAGKSAEEAKSYASRYEFEATDTDARKKEKVLQLVSELRAIDSATKSGRGWPASAAYDGIPEPKKLSEPEQPAVDNGAWSIRPL